MEIDGGDAVMQHHVSYVRHVQCACLPVDLHVICLSLCLCVSSLQLLCLTPTRQAPCLIGCSMAGNS